MIQLFEYRHCGNDRRNFAWRTNKMIPGEMISHNETIILNNGREVTTMMVSNLGDRPVQVGSHFHFYKVNTLLQFERQKAYGKRLNIPSGTAVRFEPGEQKTIELIPYVGNQIAR